MSRMSRGELVARVAVFREAYRRRQHHRRMMQQGIVQVCLLRDQPVPCLCCGRLVSARDQAILPRLIAEGLVQIGDAVIVGNPD